MIENSSSPAPLPATTPWEVSADARLTALHDRLADFERTRDEVLHGYGADKVGLPERGALPDLLRWYLRMREVCRKAGETRLEVLDEVIDRHANRLRLGRVGGLLLALATSALSVILTVALTALFSRLFPAPSPMGKP